MEKEKKDGKIRLSKPYQFEGKTYQEIDLSGLEKMKVSDMIEAEKMLSRQGSYYAVQEASMEYCCFLAAKATELPIEFFENLTAADGKEVKNVVRSFLYPQD